MRVATIESRRATSDEDIALVIQELQRQSEVRKDYIVPAKDIKAVVQDNEVMFTFAVNNAPPVIYEPTHRAHETMWNRFDINKTYYERMGDEASDLLVHNINYWAERDNRNFLARTLDDKVRAFMSDRFRTLDSVELFFTAFQEVKEIGAKIVQLDLTENNFYMKMLHPEWAVKVENFRTDVWSRHTNRPGGSLYHVLDHLEEDGGQWLVPGAVISNSDVGYGSLHGELFCFDTICWNGLVHSRTLHQVHLGRQQEVGIYSHETRELEDRVIWSKVRDMIQAGFDKDRFLELVKRLQKASTEKLEEPTSAVDTVVKNFSFSDDDKQSILNELMATGSPTVYGLLTAVTAVGRDKTNQDEAIKFERAGGDILDNPREFVRVRRERRVNRR
jgi:hypothetical protein